ncbi:MAG: hypothetical protein PHY12_13235, partial [Eubacteriales bacterium]|nr:hypothetical protein [Eubacteriales bacterium]
EAEWPKTLASSYENTTIFLQNFQNTPKPKEGKTDTVKTFLPLSEVDWDAVYPRGSDLSAQEAYSMIEGRAREIYTKYGAYGYYPMELAYGVSIQEDVNQQGPVRDLGYYAFFGFETMRGIPIVANVPFSYGTTDNFDYECLSEARYYILRVESQSAFGLAAHLFAEDAVLHEDIPLVGFDACKQQIESLITDGRIRTVYNVRLGYAVYLEPDHNRTFYRLVPSWVVECEYYDSPKDETEPLKDPEYLTSAHFRKLVINAQTGVPLDPQNKAKDRSDCPAILAWNP